MRGLVRLAFRLQDPLVHENEPARSAAHGRAAHDAARSSRLSLHLSGDVAQDSGSPSDAGEAGKFIDWQKYRLGRLQSEMRTEFKKSAMAKKRNLMVTVDDANSCHSVTRKVADGRRLFRNPRVAPAAPHIGLLWEKFRNEYPKMQHAAPIANDRSILVDETTGIPLPRVWFISKADNELIQFQVDRFYYNWRHRGDNYPRYRSVIKKFEKAKRHLEAFTNEMKTRNNRTTGM